MNENMLILLFADIVWSLEMSENRLIPIGRCGVVS